MPVSKLAHLSIRTVDLNASRNFYVAILGFKEGYRPDFQFPGIWLYRENDTSDYGIVHLVGIDQNDPSGLQDYLGDKPLSSLRGGGAVDHLAFLASNLPDMYRRLNTANLPFRERTVPNLGLHQIFVEDPSGITIELNFPAEEALAGSNKNHPGHI